MASLEAAAGNLSRLGFTVAAEGRHPFGTANRCVFLSRDTYLEFLAVDDDNNYLKAIEARNQFIVRDRYWRQENGDNGFSAMVFKTDDADQDHLEFLDAGISAGDMLEFERPFRLPDGDVQRAAFRLAFAVDSKDSDVFFFCCQRIGSQMGGKSALEQHQNGANRLLTVYMSAEKPVRYREVLEKIFRSSPSLIEPDLICYQLPNAEVRLLSNQAMFDFCGVETAGNPMLSFRGLGFGVSCLTKTASYFLHNNVAHKKERERLIVVPEDKQSPFYVFEE